MTQSPGKERKAAIAFILITLFIDILGIGIIVPVLPELVRELVDVGPVEVVSGDAEATLPIDQTNGSESKACA